MRLSLAILLAFVATSLPAQERRPSHCIAMVDAAPGAMLHRADFRDPVPHDSVRLTFLDHATFLLQTPGGLSALTDYTGYVGNVAFMPDVVTMNNAHSTHWTPFPDPAIPHVLRGWGDGAAPADHHRDLGEMLVRNVTTDTRAGRGGVVPDGNSVFVFEVAGLCIGHLGHLHHEPTAEQYAALGRLDVVMAPVDGSVTMDQASMVRVLQRLRSSIVIPMHWFSRARLEAFLDRMQDDFAVERLDANELEVSLRSLRDRPTIMVLEPAFLSD